MPRVSKPLTDIRIRKLKPKEKAYKISDGNGLYLEVRPNGKKIFRVNIKGKYTKTLGEYPYLSLSDAREEVGRIKRDEVKCNTVIKDKLFRDITNDFLVIYQNQITSKHFYLQKGRIENYILPLLQDRKIARITKGDVVRVIENIKNVKTKNTNRVKDKIELTRRIFILLKQIFKYAYMHDYVASNICDKIDIKDYLKGRRVEHLRAIIDEEEFREFVEKLFNLKMKSTTLNALKFLVYTALRNGNVRAMRWEWVDLDKRIVIIPAEELKTRKEFRLPLTDTTVDILKEQLKDRKGSMVFPSPNNPEKSLSDAVFNKQIKKITDSHTAHGFRSSFSTICYKNQHKHGYTSDIIEVQLAHEIGNTVTRAYMRSDFLEERRELLKWWEEFLATPTFGS